MTMDIEIQLVKYLEDRSNITITAETSLVEGGIIDSMGVMELIAFIEQSFGVEFDMDDLTIDNFRTINDIKNLISVKRGEA